jgi:hypothetical protein
MVARPHSTRPGPAVRPPRGASASRLGTQPNQSAATTEPLAHAVDKHRHIRGQCRPTRALTAMSWRPPTPGAVWASFSRGCRLQRCSRSRRWGLAVGLALKEQRYGRTPHRPRRRSRSCRAAGHARRRSRRAQRARAALAPAQRARASPVARAAVLPARRVGPPVGRRRQPCSGGDFPLHCAGQPIAVAALDATAPRYIRGCRGRGP